MTPRRLYGLDIETDTTTDGLDPEVAPVVAVAIVTETERYILMGDEADILRSTDEVLASLPPGVVVTWNGSRFDLPFLLRRAELVGQPIALTPDERWGQHEHLDALRIYRADVGRTLGLSCALKPLAKFLGFDPVEVDRTDISSLSADELEAYVASDADLARRLAIRRLPTLVAGT